MSYLSNLLLAVMLCFVSSFCAAEDQDVVGHAHETFTQASEQVFADKDLSRLSHAQLDKATDLVNASKGKSFKAFTDEELIAAMTTVIDGFGGKLTPEAMADVSMAKAALIKRLHDFKVTGFAFAVDPNGAFCVDTQDPKFDMVFKNSAGEIKTRRFRANIKSIGLKIQLSINLNFIFFINTDLDYSTATEPIDLGVGGEVAMGGLLAMILPKSVGYLLSCAAGINLTYAPFRKRSGGMLMASLCLGLPGGSLSVVTGGSLTPCV
jgi:hypothetical protein